MSCVEDGTCGLDIINNHKTNNNIRSHEHWNNEATIDEHTIRRNTKYQP
jgi:quinol monooxygenase YgiN